MATSVMGQESSMHASHYGGATAFAYLTHRQAGDNRNGDFVDA
jgi:hypothetical protein